jgi:hypothetical protein
MKTHEPIRFWAIAGAAAFGLVLSVADVRAQPKVQGSAQHQPAAAKLTDAERKTADELRSEQKQLDISSARVMSGSPDGRQRVSETIARRFNVPEKVVNDLRARRMGYGEVTITLALSQQLMKRGMTQQQALDKVIGLRTSGRGWGVVARDLGLKLGDVVSDVKKTDRQLAKLDVGKPAGAEKPDTLAKVEKPGKPEKVEKPERPARPEKPEKVDKAR